MYDVNSTDVFFESCHTLVPFQNPSDAAIARLSAAGFTGLSIQTILDLIVFNPMFNPKEVTLKSAGSIDETISEYRGKQAVQRSVRKRTGATHVGGPPHLVVSLVASHIYKEMPPLERDNRPYTGMTTETKEAHRLLRNMSLVHRSWTNLVQHFLFRRTDVSCSDRPEDLRRLLQHPFLSDIRELICEVRLSRDRDGYQSNELVDEAIDNVTHLMRRLRPLRYLSLKVSSESRYLDDSEPLKMRESRLYSQLSRHLPNLEGLWLIHEEVDQLRRCIKSMQNWRLDNTPITLRKLHISLGLGKYASTVIISPAILQSHDLHNEDLDCSEDVAQALKRKFGSGGTRDVFIDCNEQCAVEEICTIFVDTHVHGTVVNDSIPGIQRLAVRYPPADRHSSEVNGFRVSDRRMDVKRILRRILDGCTALSRIDVVFPNSWRSRMTGWLFSDLPSTVRALSVYLPGLSTSLGDTPKEIVDILILRNRTTRSALKRLELILCDNLDDHISDAGLDATVRNLECASFEIQAPYYLLSAREACCANGIELVVREAIIPGRVAVPSSTCGMHHYYFRN